MANQHEDYQEQEPQRIQRKRNKGYSLQSASPNGLEVVYVGRPGKWGNPYKVSNVLSPSQAVELYRLWLAEKKPDFSELKGKNLACFCREGELCHADVLLELAKDKAR